MSDARVPSLIEAFELYDMAISIRAQRFRREHPSADEAEVESCVQEWLLDRPGAPNGDAVGTPTSVPTT